MNCQIRKSLCPGLVAIMFIICVTAPVMAETGQLIVRAVGFKNDIGQALFAVVASSEAYDEIDKKAVAKSMQRIQSGKTQSCFLLAPGWYAVSVVHDENANGKLDENLLGIPKEPYGFSNNPTSLGKPSFEEVKFEIKSKHKVIEINMK